MMEQLGFQEGERVRIMGASLPKGKFVKLQPQETTFLELSDPKAVLERALSHFTCLTVGDIIEISHQHINLRFLIMEAKAHDSADAADAINILNTDIEVDFAPPVGYVEPTREPPKPLPTMAEKLGIDVNQTDDRGQAAFDAFVGQGNSLGGKRIKGKGTKARKIEELDAESRARRTECVSVRICRVAF
jgi:ubiquitin fusion degradation protein 1